MNIDAIFQAITVAGLIGLFGWVFSLQGKISTFVTRDNLAQFQRDLANNFAKVHEELKKVSEDIAFLRGKSEK
jgi:hypothetical protein